ncbi:MAG TPA: hypothetical protein VNN17_04585, partial [Terriglobia bacterium]|nr:hypothetical protein [Terriglobia bacterium]
MRSFRLRRIGGAFAAVCLLGVGQWPASAQQAAPRTTGYDLKKPVVGAACPTCPWGAMAILIKEAMKHYGWDIQICYYCAGG